jgi:hypothetical protein
MITHTTDGKIIYTYSTGDKTGDVGSVVLYIYQYEER